MDSNTSDSYGSTFRGNEAAFVHMTYGAEFALNHEKEYDLAAASTALHTGETRHYFSGGVNKNSDHGDILINRDFSDSSDHGSGSVVENNLLELNAATKSVNEIGAYICNRQTNNVNDVNTHNESESENQPQHKTKTECNSETKNTNLTLNKANFLLYSQADGGVHETGLEMEANSVSESDEADHHAQAAHTHPKIVGETNKILDSANGQSNKMSCNEARTVLNARKTRRRRAITTDENLLDDPNNTPLHKVLTRNDTGRKCSLRRTKKLNAKIKAKQGRGRGRGRPRGTGQSREIQEYKQINLSVQLYLRWQEVKKQYGVNTDCQFVKQLLDTFEASKNKTEKNVFDDGKYQPKRVTRQNAACYGHDASNTAKPHGKGDEERNLSEDNQVFPLALAEVQNWTVQNNGSCESDPESSAVGLETLLQAATNLEASVQIDAQSDIVKQEKNEVNFDNESGANDGEASDDCQSDDYLSGNTDQGKKEEVDIDQSIEKPKRNAKHYTCELCGKKYKSKKSCMTHVERHSEMPEIKPELACPVCDKRYRDRAAFRRHVRIHSGKEQEHVCEICGKQYSHKVAYRQHKLIHAEKKYHCPHCDLKCYEPRRLKKHIQCVHMNIHNFVCPNCGKAFKHKFTLEEHMRIVHMKIRAYSCNWPSCTKEFGSKRNLDVHMKIHTDEKPIKCDYCDYRCRQRSALNWHVLKKHTGKGSKEEPNALSTVETLLTQVKAGQEANFSHVVSDLENHFL